MSGADRRFSFGEFVISFIRGGKKIWDLPRG